MKSIKNLILFLLATPYTFQSFASSANPNNAEDLKLFKKVADQLKAIKTVSYHYNREFSYPAEQYHAKSEGEMFIDFAKEHDLVGFRYQFQYENGLSIFNNAELFNTNSKEQSISVSNRIKPAQLEGQSAMYNSWITLRNILPIVIEDQNILKSVGDTLIHGESYHLLTFETQDKFPNYLGNGFSKTTISLHFYQKLIVDKKSLLPITMLQTKKGSQDLNRTDFTAIHLNPKQPDENSWFYSSYLNQYQIKRKEVVKLISPGATAPDFKLTNNENGSQESLSDYKGKFVLLEFWIKNCGVCILAAPKLNALQHEQKDLKILAINTEDSDNDINFFIKKHQTQYTVLKGADVSINKNYGIAGFPQVVLIDQAGIVVYSGELDDKKINTLLSKVN